ncbi:MAG: 30S ribosomal protein S4 [Candidatus Shapirobacteria bacterium]|jgi:small subunit ribosomal protein S4|nr:30S ribosomal protein S4 [Candidatus Shapirobacteria bacterium]
MRSTLDTKCRLCRSEGVKLYLKGDRCFSPKCPLEKKGAVKPGMHGAKRSRKPTDYGIQLRAKQKAKRFYGVAETQFKNYYTAAKKLKGLVGENLLILIERRLDNVVYLSGLCLSRSHAKQLISHKEVLVNGKVLNISSYLVKVGDVITLKPKIIEKSGDTFKYANKDFKAPEWIDLDKSKSSAKIIALPIIDQNHNGIDVNLIIEYYSR